MAKKKTINLTNGNRDAVVSGDVNISYKNVRIAGLSESTTAVLETKDTICEDDIEIEYTKPSIGTVSYPVYKALVVSDEPGTPVATDFTLTGNAGTIATFSLSDIGLDIESDTIVGIWYTDSTMENAPLTNYQYANVPDTSIILFVDNAFNDITISRIVVVYESTK